MARESVILIGMPASGKSTIGKLLAAELGYDFIDLDIYIQEKAQQPLQNIIDSLGEAALMQLEKQRMEEINLSGKVIAPGGSLIYHTELMKRLHRAAIIVYLNESLPSLDQRLKNAATRGIIGLKGKSLADIYAERTPLYHRFADIVINSTGLTRQQIVQDITHHLQNMH